MSEMRERLRAVLWEKLGGSLESYGIEMGCGRESEKFAREDIDGAVTALLQAMREPTEDMCDAAEDSFTWPAVGGSDRDPYPRTVWAAMIDAALRAPLSRKPGA